MASIAVGRNGAVLTTANGGASWTARDPDITADLFGVALAADGVAGIAVGRNGAVLTTANGGASWTVRDPDISADLFGVALAADGVAGIAVGRNGAVLTTANGGASWTVRDPDISADLFGVALAADGVAGIAVGRNGAVLTTANGGASWTARDPDITADLFGVALAADGKAGIAVGPNGAVLTTANGGASWTVRDPDISADLFGVVLTADGRTGIAVGRRSTIIRSSAANLSASYTMETIERQVDESDPTIEHVPSNYRRDFRDGRKTLRDLEQKKEDLLQEIRDFELAGIYSKTSDNEKPTALENTTSVGSIRIGILVSLLFLVQILVSLSRYNIRLAGFYSARADALAILMPRSQNKYSIDMETMERLTQVLSPDTLDFGKSPRTATMQAMEMARGLVGRGTSGSR